ncbi:MAG: hypothetical protein GEV10_32025 [Streptosporangiales bacterium]|nr:hypothetical protein [Streptosporangiales bacterium]
MTIAAGSGDDMSGISVRPAALLDAGNCCEELVASQVDVAERALADAEGAPAAARMGSMVSAGSARSCIDGWQETLRSKDLNGWLEIRTSP